MTNENSELKNIVEAALLVAGVPLTIDKLLTLFPEESRPSRDDVRRVLDEIGQDCENRGIELKRIDQGYRFQTRQKYAEWIARLSEERPVRYSRALLETLAIIAYRQPVTRGEIEDIRGVAVSTETIKTLLGREWVREVGRRDVPGRPVLYGTTRGFLEHFNLRSLEEMPPLAELRDVDKIAAELNLRLPVDEQGPADEPAAPSQDDTPEAEAQSTTPVALDAAAEEKPQLEARSADPDSPAIKL